MNDILMCVMAYSCSLNLSPFLCVNVWVVCVRVYVCAYVWWVLLGPLPLEPSKDFEAKMEAERARLSKPQVKQESPKIEMPSFK